MPRPLNMTGPRPSPRLKPRLAVLSPFVDKRHGTERCLAEQMERLAGSYEIHLYSSHVDDLDLSHLTWHKVPIPPGPHLARYVWWFFANKFCRWRDRRFRGLAPDVVYSPGVNCLDADVVSVHVLFGNLRRKLNEERKRGGASVSSWPVVLHRRIYYRLIEYLESKVYAREDISLLAVSQTVAREVGELYGRRTPMPVIYHGVDGEKFSPGRRVEIRAPARARLGISADECAILLIGNNWENKGLPCLLEAVGKLQNPALRIIVAGQDSPAPYQERIQRLGLAGQVIFAPHRPDVEFYYAAADIYAGPSAEDTFSLPHAEAMACGLPAITSRVAGVSEIMHHGEDGLILEDAADARTLSKLLALLVSDPALREKMGEKAARTAAQYTWERNAQQLGEVLSAMVQKRGAR